MAVQTTSNLSNSVRTKYLERYLEAAESVRMYDQFSTPVGQAGVKEAIDGQSPVQVPFLSDIAIGTTTISQTADVTPVTQRDSVATITPTSRWGAIQWAEALDIRAYTNYGEARFKAIGKHQMETVDWLAAVAALQGANLYRAVARASLDAGTSGHRLGYAQALAIQARLQGMKCPTFPLEQTGGQSSWMMLAHVDAFYDLLQDATIQPIGQYHKGDMLLNFELGRVGAFKIVADARAKVFGAAGIDHASIVATTLASSATALATAIVVTTLTNITFGRYLTIGTEETANTWYETNERVMVSADYSTGTTINIIGESANSALRWDHAGAEAVRNADSVYPVAVGSSLSLAKLFAKEAGPYGEVIGPKVTGLLDQFTSLGWKFYGGYGRWREGSILRAEVASSMDNVSSAFV